MPMQKEFLIQIPVQAKYFFLIQSLLMCTGIIIFQCNWFIKYIRDLWCFNYYVCIYGGCKSTLHETLVIVITSQHGFIESVFWEKKRVCQEWNIPIVARVRQHKMNFLHFVVTTPFRRFIAFANVVFARRYARRRFVERRFVEWHVSVFLGWGVLN